MADDLIGDEDFAQPFVGARGDRYHAVCPACDWESAPFPDPADAEVAASEHACEGQATTVTERTDDGR